MIFGDEQYGLLGKLEVYDANMGDGAPALGGNLTISAVDTIYQWRPVKQLAVYQVNKPLREQQMFQDRSEVEMAGYQTWATVMKGVREHPPGRSLAGYTNQPQIDATLELVWDNGWSYIIDFIAGSKLGVSGSQNSGTARWLHQHTARELGQRRLLDITTQVGGDPDLCVFGADLRLPPDWGLTPAPQENERSK